LIKPHYKYLLIEPIQVEQKEETSAEDTALSSFYTDIIKGKKAATHKIYEVVRIVDYSENCEQFWKPYVGAKAIVNSNQVEHFDVDGKQIHLAPEAAIFATLGNE
jgi:hypothetical protein